MSLVGSLLFIGIPSEFKERGKARVIMARREKPISKKEERDQLTNLILGDGRTRRGGAAFGFEKALRGFLRIFGKPRCGVAVVGLATFRWVCQRHAECPPRCKERAPPSNGKFRWRKVSNRVEVVQEGPTFQTGSNAGQAQVSLSQDIESPA